MGLSGRMLASIVAAMALAPVLLTAYGWSVKSCAGQCGPPFRLQVVFRDGTSKQGATAAMRGKCQADPLVIRIGQPFRPLAGLARQVGHRVIYTQEDAHRPRTCSAADLPAPLTGGAGRPPGRTDHHTQT